MCGRYTIRRIDSLIRFGAIDEPSFEQFSELRLVPRFNIAPSSFPKFLDEDGKLHLDPTQPKERESNRIPIVRPNKDGEPVISPVLWGLVPSWTKGVPEFIPKFAKAEAIQTNGMFRNAFERRRCIMPADGFYEWMRIDEKRKQPFFIRRKDNELFGMAAIWERWTPGPEMKAIDTCAVITCASNRLMSGIHDRMPVILRERDYARWLDRSIPGSGVADVLQPYEWEGFETIPVSTYVNKSSNDGPHCIEPIEVQ